MTLLLYGIAVYYNLKFRVSFGPIWGHPPSQKPLFIPCHNVCISPISQKLCSSCVTKFAFILSQSLHLFYLKKLCSSCVARFAFILCNKVCVCPLSQSLCLSYITKFADIFCDIQRRTESFNSYIHWPRLCTVSLANLLCTWYCCSVYLVHHTCE